MNPIVWGRVGWQALHFTLFASLVPQTDGCITHPKLPSTGMAKQTKEDASIFIILVNILSDVPVMI